MEILLYACVHAFIEAAIDLLFDCEVVALASRKSIHTPGSGSSLSNYLKLEEIAQQRPTYSDHGFGSQAHLTVHIQRTLGLLTCLLFQATFLTKHCDHCRAL